MQVVGRAPDGLFGPVAARIWVRIPVGLDVCHQGRVYNTVLKTV